MANVMSLKSIRNKVSRNGFDLSYRNQTTTKVGQVEVLSCKPCFSGEQFDISTRWFTRTRPVNTAAFTRIREHVNWYFVPYNLLWNKFNTWFSQMTDNAQHASSINGVDVLTENMPYFTEEQINQFVHKVNNADGTASNEVNIFGYNRAELTCKLLHSLGYGDFYRSMNEEITYANPRKLNPFRLLGYQKIYMDYIRNSQWEKMYAPACNIDYLKGTEDSLNIPVDDIDTSDDSSMFEMRYCDWPKDYFMGLLPNAQYGDSVSVPMTNENLEIALAELGEVTGFSANSSNILGTTINNTTGNASVKVPVDSQLPIYEIGTGKFQLELALTRNDVIRLRQAMGLSATPDGSDSGSALTSTFTILALRNAEAMQKLREIQQSTKQNFKDQTEAIWDVTVDDAYSEQCKWLGGSSNMLEITEQVNTNLTDGNAANIAGKGVGTGQDKVRFRTEVPGMLYCIYTAQPMLDYSLSGITHDALRSNIMDFPNPVLDKTGMVSIPAIELTRYEVSADKLLGYAPRYADLKTSVDEVHGAFYNGSVDDLSWVAPVNDEYIRNYIDSVLGVGYNELLTYVFMKVNPNTLDPIFDTDANSSVNTDQLKIQIAFDYKAVRPYDYNGLPY